MTVRLQKGAFFVPSQTVRIRLTKENFLIMINVKYEKTVTKRSTYNGTDREDFSC